MDGSTSVNDQDLVSTACIQIAVPNLFKINECIE